MQAQDMPMEEEKDLVNNNVDETVDDEPAFISPEDAGFVEVQVDDDDVPMEEDDDEDDVAVEEETVSRTVVDMSRLKLESHTGPVYALAVHMADDDATLTILSGGGDDRAFVHKILSNTAVTTQPLEHNHTDSVSSVAHNLDFVSEDLTKTPRFFAVGAYDGAIVLYDGASGAKIRALEGPTDVESLCFHPKGGSVLLAGSTDGTIWMFHVVLNKCLQVFVGHESAVTDATFSPDGRWALSISSDGTLRIWAPRTGASKHIFRLGAGLTTMAVGGGGDGQLVVAGSEDGQAHVCHIGTKKVVASVRHYELPRRDMQTDDEDEEEMELPMSVEAVGFCPSNPNWFATGGVDGTLKVWDLANEGQCRQTCRIDTSSTEEESGGITRLQWHPTLPLVFCSYTNGSICLWDARDARLRQTITGNTQVLNDLCIKFVDDGKRAIVVSGGDDNVVRVFDVDVAAALQQ